MIINVFNQFIEKQCEFDVEIDFFGEYRTFIYTVTDYQAVMRKCELCGAETSESLPACPRCGFEFQREIRSDTRDRAILEKHGGKSVDNVKRDIRNRQARFTAYLENLSAKNLSPEELVTLLNDALTFLEIPLALGAEDELKFESAEREFINLMAVNLDRADAVHGMPIGSGATYVRFSNAFLSMGEPVRAMAMIERGLLINPKDRDAIFGKAILLFRLKKYDAAKKCLERLVSAGADENVRYLYELMDQMSTK